MRIAILASALLFTLVPAVAHAEDPDSSPADALFREGRQAAEAGNYAVACPKFEESYRLDPAAGTLLNLGDCEENRGQLARAWKHFRQLYDRLPATDDRRPIADARARAVEARAPKLRIVLTATSPASVTRDDVVVGRGSLGTSVPVEPGRHVVVVTSIGRREKRYEVSVNDGEDKELTVSSGEPLADAAPAPVAVVTLPAPSAVAAPLATQPPRRDGSGQRTAAYVVGGVGLATFVTGTIFGVVALSRLSSANAACTGNVCASQDALSQFHGAQSFAIVSDVTIGIGIALIGTAVFLALTAPHGNAASASIPLWMGGRF
ncbi:MAG TPA: hypothetical protein VF316_24460 [Polyangiaceae bacterium]